MSIEDEVKVMNDILDGKVVEEPTPTPIPEPTPEPEVKEEEPIVDDKVETPEPEPKPEPTPTPEPEVKEDPRDARIAALEAKLAALEAKPKETIEPKVEVPAVVEDVDFVKDLDLDEVTRDPNEFNKVMNQVYKKGLADSEQRVVEKVLKTLPDIIQNNIKITQELEKTRDDFYNENPDLKGFQQVVATVFDELSKSNPGKGYKDLITLTGPEVRTRLGLPKPGPKPVERKQAAPKLPSGGGKGGREPEKQQLSGVESEIEAMNRVVR